jgi:RHS repeat-associated protein
MDRVLTRKDPLGNTECYGTFSGSTCQMNGYDGLGNLLQFTDRRGKVTTFSYDSLNRMIFAGYGTQAGPSYESTVSYTYDAGDRATQVVDSLSGTITPVFDGLDRLTSETTPQGSISYTYDLAGRRQTMTVAGQSTVNYTFDAAGRPTQVTQGSSFVQFTYDTANRRATLTLPNGIVTSYSFDNASQLTGMTYSLFGTLLGNLANTYDQNGRRNSVTGSFARTGIPNPVSTTAYNANNQLATWGTANLFYDANGNMTSDGTHSYTWDARNHLKQIDGGSAASFTYDPYLRRVSKNILGSSTSFLYDGLNPVQELSGATPAANLLTGSLDEYFQRADPAGTRNFLTDALGSTLALTDSTGTLQTSYTFAPFGNTSVGGAATTNSFAFTGREADASSASLYFYRARYYSPQLQRFASEDPFRFSGGNANLYVYAANDPLDWTDPSGEILVPLIITGIGAAVGGAVEGIKAYKCGKRGWDLAGKIGRGALAGGAGSLLGLAAGLGSENPYVGGAVGAGVYSLINDGPPTTWEETANLLSSVALGGAFGGLGETLAGQIRGGQNFKPFTSPRTWGPKAQQAYAGEIFSQDQGLFKEVGAGLAGRGNCACKE